MENRTPLRIKAVDRINRDQIVTLGDLENFRKELLNDVKAILSNIPQTPVKRWVKGYELKKIIDISPGTLRTLRNKGLLPFTWLGGTPYYDLNELNRLLSEGAIKEIQMRKRIFPS